MAKYKKDDRVTARYGGDWFTGRVTAVRQGTVHVLFDDGDKDKFSSRSTRLRHDEIAIEPTTVPPGYKADPEQPPYDGSKTPAPKPLVQSLGFTRHVIHAARIEQLDELIAKLEALREVAATIGGRRYIVLQRADAADDTEVVLRIDTTGQLLSRTSEKKPGEYTTVPIPARRKQDMTGEVQDDPETTRPKRRGRRARSKPE